MKMRENSGKKLKGSVLFTVIAVMMVVLVFVMSALTIAGATSRRAYSDYAKKQTQYTARTAIEATIEYLNENEDFQKLVEGMGKGATKDVTIDFPDDAKGIGSIDVQIKCEGTDKDTGEDIVTITAKSGMLNDETSVVAFISKKSPVVKNGDFLRAMTSMGGASISNHTSVFGGTSVNVIPDVELYEEKGQIFDLLSDRCVRIQNEGALEGQTFVNGDLYVANKSEFIFDKPGDALIINGSYWEQNGAKFTSNVAKSAITSYTQLPYIFVRDTMFFQAGGEAYIGSSDKPNNLINIYCGNIVSTTKTRHIYGDIYAFNTDELYGDGNHESLYYNGWNDVKDEKINEFNNALSVFKSDGTNLINWAEEVINGADGKDYCGGSMYTAGSISCQSSLNINKNLYIQQGLYVTQGLNVGSTLSSDSTVEDGTIYVGGDLIVDGVEAFTANKLIVEKDIQLETGSSFKLWDGTSYKIYNEANIGELNSNPYFVKVDNSAHSQKWTYPEELTWEKLLTSGGGFVTTQEEMIANYYGEIAGTSDKGFYGMKKAPATTNNVIYKYENDKLKRYEKGENGILSYDAETGTYSDTWDNSGNYVFTGEISPSNDASETCKFTISESCTFLGTWNLNTVNIKIDPSVQDLSINCVDWSVTNGNIVVDDARDPVTFLPKSKVTFYTKTYIELNSVKIITKTYESLLNSDVDIKQTPTLGIEAEMNYIPNIYIYTDGTGTKTMNVLNENKVEISTNIVINAINNSMITGYIFSPEGAIQTTNSHKISSINYENQEVHEDYKPTFNIGAVICGNIYSSNNASIFYVNPNGNGAGAGDEIPGSYKVLYYNNG